MKIGLIDYGRGNLRSVEKALERVGADVERVDAPEKIEGAEALVLPGVGAFGDAMRNLAERKLVQPIVDWVKADRLFLGICLGFQLLFEESEESEGVKGLGVLAGKVARFPDSVGKVPHMGWNQVWHREESVFRQLDQPSFFYHVHSFYPEGVDEEWVAFETEYGGLRFVSGVSKGNVHAVQFHPEKSQENGRKLLEIFVQHPA